MDKEYEKKEYEKNEYEKNEYSRFVAKSGELKKITQEEFQQILEMDQERKE